ncbi:sensor histidine kinase [Kribbella sp. NPDC048928]|uniref:sensor histidine kinase n=1 Tax=Kribbella sp. NPDC048928 TaxID=3364111 RepID=UPI00371B0D14
MDRRPPQPAAATLAFLRQAEHALFAVLLVIGAVRTLRTGAWIAAALVAAWYVLGVVLARRTPGPRVAAGWFAGLVAGWIVLAVLSVDFVWLSFALFLLAMQLLPRAIGPVVVAGLTAIAVATIAVHDGRLTTSGVLGPVIGAAVAVVIMSVYRNLRQQNEVSTRLLAELTAAQDQLATAQREAGVLAERERLAGEIHDTTTQSVSAIILILKSAVGRWPDAPPAAREQLDAAIDSAQSALEDTRRLIRALTPAPLAGRPLADALEQLVEDSGRYGLAARLTVDGTPYPMATPAEVALLRAGQEAIANIRAHAEAAQTELTLTFHPGAVSLDIVDDGRGFDPDRPRTGTTGTGLGLAAMRRRLEAVGGSLVIETAPGRGTAISARIPAEEALA